MLEFVLRHPTRPLDAPTVRWIVDHYGGSAGDLRDQRTADGFGLVGCMLPSGADGTAAELFVMAFRPRAARAPLSTPSAASAAPANEANAPPHPADAALFDELSEWAEGRARARGARSLETTLAPLLAPFAPALRTKGWLPAFRQLLLVADHLAPRRLERCVPPPHLTWVDLDEQNVTSAHECYERALKPVSGATVLPLEQFRDLLDVGDFPTRCLAREDGRVVALSRVVWSDEPRRQGEVRTICRHPDHAEPQLGRYAMAEAIRQLRTRGAESACVEVAANNLLAVGLYRSFGFVDRAVSEALRKPLE